MVTHTAGKYEENGEAYDYEPIMVSAQEGIFHSTG